MSRIILLKLLASALVVPTAWHAASAHAQSEYHLQVGDVLEISAVGVPNLRQRITVGTNGMAPVPLVGDLPAVGQSLTAVRERVRQTISTKDVRLINNEGREFRTVISPEEVNLVIVEHRPVYLNGDVARAGEQSFRIGMTVRQAVALAGGYNLIGARLNNPLFEAADLKSQFDTLNLELVREQARIRLVQAELDGKVLTKKEIGGERVDSVAHSRAVDLEMQQFTARVADHQKEKTHLQNLLKQAENRLAVLTDQKNKEEEGARLDIAEGEKVRDLLQKGVVAMNRATEARRLSLLSSTRALETMVHAEQARKERDETARKLQALDDRRRIDGLKELQTGHLKISELRSRLQSVGEKLLYTGAARSQLERGRIDEPEVSVFRSVKTERKRLNADENTELQPGDVVEITMRVKYDATRVTSQ